MLNIVGWRESLDGMLLEAAKGEGCAVVGSVEITDQLLAPVEMV